MRKIIFTTLLISMTMLPFLNKSASAEEQTSVIQTEEEKSKTYMKIGTVTVSEKRGYFATEDIPASVDVIGEDILIHGSPNSSMELVRRLPGAYYAYYNQGVCAGNPGIRGFMPGSSVMALIVDGIPWNRTAGGVNLESFFPLEIERMELLRGTVDPRWGAYNLAGNLNVFTKRGGNRTEGKVLYGSWDTVEGNALLAREEDGFSQTYFVGYRSSDGCRDHSDQQKGALSGKWFYKTNDDKLSAGVIARYFKWETDSPGYLTKKLAEQDPKQMMVDSKTDGGEQEDEHISAHFDYQFTPELAWSLKTYWQKMTRTRWSTWSPGGDQGERYRDDNQYGALSKLYFETPDIGIKNLKLEWGLDFQYSDNIHNRYRPTDNRVRGPWRTYQGKPWNFEYTNKNWGSYISADAVFTDWIRLMAGIRMDRFDGELENPTAGERHEMTDFGTIWQPKLGLVITPLTGYNIYGNWGRSFQLPSEQNRFGIGTKPDISYSKNDGWEVGTKCSPTDWIAFRLAYWEMTATDEVKWVSALNWSDNVGETERKGWDASVSLAPADWVAIWAAYTAQEGEYIEGISDASKGKNIERVPPYTAKGGVDFSLPCNISTSLWLESLGDYYIDSANTKEKDGGYTLVHMRLAHIRNNFTYALDVHNLFDEEYYGYVWDSSSGYGYTPGDGLAVYGSITFNY